MARITVVSMAFWGDVMPFVPIANELAGRGHDVTFAVPEGFHELLRHEQFSLTGAGVQFSPRELAEHGDIVARAGRGVGAARAGRFWVGEFGVKHLGAIHRALLDATGDADLVLTHPTCGYAARMAAEIRRIPWVTGHLFPMMLPGDAHLPAAYPFRRPGRTPSPRHARAAWNATVLVSRVAMFDRQINAFRRALGLDPVRANALLGGTSPTDVLLLASPHYLDWQPDWPAHYQATGFTVWPGPAGQNLPAGLRDHLAAGDPPVLVTLGTAAAGSAAELLSRLAGELDRRGTRAVFLVGDAARNHPDLRDRRDTWSFAPLPDVLPFCRAVVHAGGHGTTAAVLSAGLPALVLPQIFDQVWHGERVAFLGAGLSVPGWARHPDRIGPALDRVLNDDTLANGAERMAKLLATEDGPATAADLIESRLAAAASAAPRR